MRMLRSKKGEEMTFGELIQVILAVIGILILVGVIFGLISMFIEKPDSGTENQFLYLYDAVDTLYSPGMNETACKIPIGYIEPGYAIIGFNKKGVGSLTNTDVDEDGEYVEEHCGNRDAVYKPESCYDSACLCLCYGGTGDVTDDDCDGERCERFNEEVSRLHTYLDEGHYDLVLYGESCWFGLNDNVIAGYIVKRRFNQVEIRAVYEETDFTMLQMPDCENIKPVPIEKKPAAPVDQGPSLDKSLDAIKQAGQSEGITGQ